MNILLKSVHLISPGHPFNGKNCDIYIEDGNYKKIAESILIADCKKGTEEVKLHGAYISAGWIDMRSRFTEPGFEQKETIASGLNAAAAGGFAGVVMMPSVNPPLQTRAGVEYIVSRGKGMLTDVYPAGCLTVKREGKEMAELYDMKLGGAIAFTDDQRYINDSGVMLRLLQYTENIGSTVIVYADDRNMSGDLQANQSPATTMLGFKGSPAVAEEIALGRDILLSKYADVRIHVAGVSTAGTVAMIRDAKKNGLKVTAEVNSYHLLLTDDSLDAFDTNYKVKPPLRTLEDVDALKQGVADGTIDVVVSDHTPEDIESKQVEWDFAAHGIINLETTFGILNTALSSVMPIEKIIETITVNPRKILGLQMPSFNTGEKACFTLFDPTRQWVYYPEKSRSLSRNSPFNGFTFKGKPLAVGNNGQFEMISD